MNILTAKQDIFQFCGFEAHGAGFQKCHTRFYSSSIRQCFIKNCHLHSLFVSLMPTGSPGHHVVCHSER